MQVARRRAVFDVGTTAGANVVALYDVDATRWSSPRERVAVPHPSLLPRVEVGSVVDVLTDASGRRWIRAAGQDVALGDAVARGSASGVQSFAGSTANPLVAHPMVDGRMEDLVRRQPLEEHVRTSGRGSLGGLAAGALLVAFAVVAELATNNDMSNPVLGLAVGGLLVATLAGAVALALPRGARSRRASLPGTPVDGEVWAWWSAGLEVAVEPWVTVVVGGRALSWPLHGDVLELHGRHAEDDPTTWSVVGPFEPGARPRLERGSTRLRASGNARDDVPGPRRPGTLAWPE